MPRDPSFDIVVIGGPNTDYLVRGPGLPTRGATVQGDEFLSSPGGKGSNQAVAAARLGARVAIVARIGHDERGDALRWSLVREGVDTRYVVRDRQAPTGAALIHVERGGEKQIMVAPGANALLSPRDVLAAAGALDRARVVVASLEVPLAAVRAAFERGRRAGARVVLDPAPVQPLDDEFLALVDVIRLNSGEARELTGVEVGDRDSARKAAQVLLERGAGAAAVQAGQEGNLLVWSDGECWLPRIEVESVDATGAGDAFGAALAVGLAERLTWAQAGRLASATAALATTRFGAQAGLPRRDQAEELMRHTWAPAGEPRR